MILHQNGCYQFSRDLPLPFLYSNSKYTVKHSTTFHILHFKLPASDDEQFHDSNYHTIINSIYSVLKGQFELIYLVSFHSFEAGFIPV